MTSDETQPLLRGVEDLRGKDIVDFDPSGDPENPRDWPKAYKWGLVALLAFLAFTV
jgi:hypothetical protein